MVSSCDSCLTFSLFNVIFFASGVGLIVEGFRTLTIYKEYVDFTGNTGTVIPKALICVGFFIILITFLGCAGAYRDKYGVIGTYVFLMVLLLIVELGAGIAGYVLRDDIDQLVDENMTNLQQEYNSSTSTKRLFDSLQQGLKCCGVNNYRDWMGWIAEEPNNVPNSCCRGLDIPPGCHIVGSPLFDIYTDPCYPALKDVLISQIGILAGVAIGIAVLEIFGLTCGCCLMRSIKKDIRELREIRCH